MKLLDKLIAHYGYHKIEEHVFGVFYEKKVLEYEYTSVIAILHKANGNHIIQCYDKKVQTCDGKLLNSVDGIAIGLLPLLYLKVVWLARKYKWNT